MTSTRIWGEPTMNSERVVGLLFASRGSRYMCALTGVFVGVMILYFAYNSVPNSKDFSPTFQLVHDMGLPWWLWSVMWFAYSIMLLPLQTRFVGYLVGFVLYGFWGVALILHFSPSIPYPIIGTAAIYDVVAFHIASAWMASKAQSDRE